MTGNFLFGVSLTTSFLAGMLALFAPCCLTFLLPSYLGTVFKKTEKVMFYTAVFAAGLATILVPVALGFKLLVTIFDQFHGAFYYVGAVILVLMGLMTIFEVRLPINIGFSRKPDKKVDVFSVYTLGIFSGVTSSCCAPVLFAAIALTSLAPTLLQAVIVASAYVLGMVFPLFLMSLLYDKISIKIMAKAKRDMYVVFKFLGGAIFIATGIGIAVLNAAGKIVMRDQEAQSSSIRMFVFNVSKYFKNPVVDIAVFLLILSVFFLLLRLGKRKVAPKPDKITGNNEDTIS